MSVELVKHMQLFYGDRNIVEDLDCVLLACASEEERKAVRNYAALRRRTPGFKPGDFHANNHRSIQPALLSLAGEKANALCAECGGAFHATRNTARYCTPRCRKRASRIAATPVSSR